MGILFRSRTAPARIEPVLPRAETRATSRYGDGWGISAGMTGVGGGISTAAAEGLSAVLACVGLLAESAASLPASIGMDSPDGIIPAPPTLAAQRLLRRPNPRQSWSAFVTTMASSVLLQGNAVAVIGTDGRGGVDSLTPIPWPWLTLRVVTGQGRARIVYEVTTTTPEAALLGIAGRQLLDTEVLHIRARSDNGIVGRSVLSRAAGPIREAIELNTVAESTWHHGLRPSGSLTTEQKIDDAQRDRLRNTLADFTGPGNTGKVLVLSQGLKFNPLSLNPADAELLDSRRFSVAEVCRLFRVPEALVQSGAGHAPASYTPLIAAFATLALSPLVNAIEQEIDAQVLPPGYHINLDMSGLQRGDYPAVAAAQAVLVQSGIATANDGRRALGLAAHDAGDQLRPNGAPPSYPADGAGLPSLAPKPGLGGPLDNVGTNEGEGAHA